jgi:3-deoxy-D-manno-octulosonic-acid transferase
LRVLYVLLTYLVAPLVIAVEGWRELRDPAQRGRLRQRLGCVAPRASPGCVWVHAVSVGEVQAAAAFVKAFAARFPDRPILVTTVTPTGAQRATELLGARVQHGYLPYDLPGSVRRFLDRARPQVAIVLETEIWPTLYAALGRRDIPLVMASARVTPRSVGRYRRMASLFRETLARGVLIGAQTAADAERFRAIGAAPERVVVTGNVKFDMEIPQAAIDAGLELRRALGPRPVWVAGSTHEGEEAAALEAHAIVRTRHPDALLVLVPRHPPRFEAVRELLHGQGCACTQRSSGGVPGAEHEVFLGDTLGELQMFYAASDVAFVGGSLVPIGGHSLLEPAMLGLPILSGPYTHNGQEIADLLLGSGALAIVRDAGELGQRVADRFDDPARARADGARGRATVAQSRGAVGRLVAMVAPLLSPPGG